MRQSSKKEQLNVQRPLPPPRGGRAVLGGRARSDGVTRTKVPVPWLEGLGAYLQPLPSLSEPQPSHCPGPTHRGGDPVN